MERGSRACLSVIFTSALLLTSSAVRADEIRTVTGGTVVATTVDAGDVVLTAPGFFLSAHMFEGIGAVSCRPCTAGETISLLSAWGGSIPATNVLVQVDNQPAGSAFLGGFLELDGGSVVVPETASDLLFIQRPFRISPHSHIVGWDDSQRTRFRFNVELDGSGTVTFAARRVPNTSIFDVRSLTWVFSSGPMSPVPEPASALLMLTGAGGFAAAWLRRKIAA